MAETQVVTPPTTTEEEVAVNTAAAAVTEEQKSKGKDEEKDEKEDINIYSEELPNRIIVGRNRPLSFYVDRARRVFRVESSVDVTGRGDNIATACKLVEALKRQKIAVIDRISTGMNVEPYFNSYGDARWGQPSAVIIFKLKRGELGAYISDFQQRKVIEIFEKNDEKNEGILTLEKVESLQIETKFKANPQQIQEAKTFLSQLKESNLDLPTFIKYVSILIHPLLKNKVFKDVLTKEFNIQVSGAQRTVDEETHTD